MKNSYLKIIGLVLTLIILNSSFLIRNCISQWVPDTNGIGWTTERSLAVSGTNIFTGTFSSGVYLSTNNGTSWSQTSLNNQFVFSLAVNGSNIFAGTYGNGLYLSTNNGSSWSQSSLINQYVVSLAVSGNNIFAGVYYNGVYLSTNNGLTWSQTALNTGDVYSLAVNGINIYAGTALHGVYISSNNGNSWIQSSLNNQTIQSLFINGNDIFAGTYYSAGIYLSTNNGTTWNQTSLTNRSIYSFALSGNDIIAGSDGYGVYVSSNNGTSWVQRNEGLVGMERVYGLCILNNYIFSATDYSEYRRGLGEFLGIKQISEQIPNYYTLSQNYPNPFNPTTKIRFALPKNSFTKLGIYNILGGEVTTLVNDQLNAGTYEVVWSADNFPSGVYFFKLETGSFIDTKKMILIK
jgi:hypothetical protein